MKATRFIAAWLLILTGLLHALLFFSEPKDENALQLLVFGILYFAIGILMILNSEFSAAWGIIFPILGIGAGFFVIGFQHWNMMLGGLYVIDGIIAGCCTFLFFRNERNWK